MMTDETKKRIGDYEILNELGSGGMGRVYRVRNVISDRIEAMKILLPDLAGRQELADRFLREIKVLASLNHPNIASLRTALTIDNQLVMIMEYVEGTSLAQRIERGPIPVPDALNYMDQALDALSYAHKQGVIHRDIKPANMMLTPQGVVKLMDFGIARAGEDRSLTMTGTTLGSISYMSPEQVKGETADARSDLYSVGVSLYEMVTGQRPFQADSDFSIMTAHVKVAPKPPLDLQPGLPPALNEIILMAIAKEPAQRFQSADALRNALRSVQPPTATAQPVTQISRAATMVETAVSASFQPPPSAATPSSDPSSAPVPVNAKVTPTPATPPVVGQMPLPSPPPSGHRGLYMTLGALIVLAVLVAAGIYWPGRGKANLDAAKNSVATLSDTKSAPEPLAPNPPADANPSAGMPMVPPTPTPASNPAPTTAPNAMNAAASNSTANAAPSAASNPAPNAAAHAAPNTSVQSASLHTPVAGKSPKPQQLRQAVEAAPAKADSKELDEVEHSVDQLTARAGAVNKGLDSLSQQQAAYGGLRGDMAARQESMKLNLSKAQAAVEHGDTERAKHYSDLAQADMEVLERFLGH